MDTFESLSHSVWECKYHVVFIPKCRRKTLYGTLRQHLGEVFRKLAAQTECRIEEGHLLPDHVHMMIAIPSKYAVSQVVGFVNGKNAIHLARVYGEHGTSPSVMELIRTFFEEVVEEACRRIEAKVGTPAPSGPKISHYAPYRPYLQTSGIVGLEESELLQKLYNFLSNQGAHTLGTAPEQLRAAHAMVIELCMLIAGRVQMYLAT